MFEIVNIKTERFIPNTNFYHPSWSCLSQYIRYEAVTVEAAKYGPSNLLFRKH